MGLEVLLPEIRCVEAFTAVAGEARAHLTQDRGVDTESRDNDLPLGEGGKLFK
jgi:hypothetical protein